MNIRIFGGISVAAFVAFLMLNISISIKENNMSDVFLTNLEALAKGEGDGSDCDNGCCYPCYGSYCCTVIINGTGFALNKS